MNRQRLYLLILLTAANTAAFLDKQVMAILFEPIRLELHFTDTELGFIGGMTFAIFYIVAGIPLSFVTDRINRRNLLSTFLAMFSVMTAVCGLAQNFWQLALARTGVAIGEGGSGPCIHSMIADVFTHERRATAFGFYAMGVSFGVLIAFLAGGYLAQHYGWRLTFLIMGLPGLVVSLLILLLLREPVRGASDALESQATHKPKPFEVLRYLASQRAYLHTIAGCALLTGVSAAIHSWLPTFFARSYGMQPAAIGAVLAPMLGILGAIGSLGSGFVADRLGRRDIRWSVWTVAVAGAIIAPFFAATFLSESSTVALLFFAVPALLVNAQSGPTIAAVQTLTPVRMRAVAAAVQVFALTLVGTGFGTQIVGILSDLYGRT